jgi:hypothetical protein
VLHQASCISRSLGRAGPCGGLSLRHGLHFGQGLQPLLLQARLEVAQLLLHLHDRTAAGIQP